MQAPWPPAPPPDPGLAAAAAAVAGAASGTDLAVGSWVEVHQTSINTILMATFGGIGPFVLVLAAVAVAFAVPRVLKKESLAISPEHFYGLTPWQQVMAAGALLAMLLLNVVVAAASSGGDGGFSAAARVLDTARTDVESVSSIVVRLNATGAALLSELGKLGSECPPSVTSVLGGSIQEATTWVKNFLLNVGVLQSMLLPLPSELDTLQSLTAGAGASMNSWLATAVLVAFCSAAFVGVVAADLQLLGSKLRRFMGRCTCSKWAAEKGGLMAVGGIAGVLMTCSAAVTLAVGRKEATLCRDLGSESLRFLGEAVGWNSSAYSLARYYVAGEGVNFASAQLASATTSATDLTGWITNYKWAIQQSCPQWNADGLLTDLGTAGEDIALAERLLLPSRMYPVFTEAAWGDVCGTLASTGWLVLLQALVGIGSLPLLTTVGCQFLRYHQDGHAYSRLNQSEKDPDDSDKDNKDSADAHDFNPMYYVVYAFSIFEFVVGAFMYYLPSFSIIRRITGAMLYGSGIFLLTNSDLVVTYFRMMYQLGRFSENNEKFTKSLDTQATLVRKLTNDKKSLDTIKTKFKDDVKGLVKETQRGSNILVSDLRMCCMNLMRLYSDKGGNGVLDDDAVKESYAMFRTVFAGLYRKDYGKREKAAKAALDALLLARAGADSTTPPTVEQKFLADLFAAVLSECNLANLDAAARSVVEKYNARGGGAKAPTRSGAFFPPKAALAPAEASPSRGTSAPTASPPRGTSAPAASSPSGASGPSGASAPRAPRAPKASGPSGSPSPGVRR